MFQFYLSSIKSIRQITIFQREPCFNSTLVQLKGLEFLFGFIVLALFQFYLSSIKRTTLGDFNNDFNKFQFYLSSIKRFVNAFLANGAIRFQFYLSSIKRIGCWNKSDLRGKFQFYLSSIKSGCWIYSKNTIRKVSILP